MHSLITWEPLGFLIPSWSLGHCFVALDAPEGGGEEGGTGRGRLNESAEHVYGDMSLLPFLPLSSLQRPSHHVRLIFGPVNNIA